MSYFPIDLHLAWVNLPALCRGLVINVALTFITLGIGLVTSLLVTLARMSPNRVVSSLAGLYVLFFRGVPLLILLYLVYYGIAQIKMVRDGPFWIIFGSAFCCAVIALVLNHTAYMVEVVRGALEAVPAGLIEASKALGISPRDTFFNIRLPLAMRFGLKAYQNEVVMFAKATAVVGTVTVIDLTAVANSIFEDTYDPFTPLLTAALLYWIFVNTLRLVFKKLDKYLNRHLSADEATRGTIAAQLSGKPVAPVVATVAVEVAPVRGHAA